MSVTFAPEYRETDVVIYELQCNEQAIGTALTYADAQLDAQAHGLVCKDDLCAGYGADIITITEVPEINVNNGNAHYLLGLLGLIETDGDRPGPFEYGDMSGACPAEDFLGRVLMAQALTGHDEGVPLHVLRNQHDRGPTVYDCGRREGYAEEKLAELAELARWAQQAARAVQ
jgi:hypothetical protein